MVRKASSIVDKSCFAAIPIESVSWLLIHAAFKGYFEKGVFSVNIKAYGKNATIYARYSKVKFLHNVEIGRKDNHVMWP